MIPLVLVFFCLNTHGTIANPTGPVPPQAGILTARNSNSTHPTPTKSTGWIDGPEGRGTWDILFSCGTTLLLCAYTAYHPNVPGFKKKNVFLKRVSWMLVALLAPEIVLGCASYQWWGARRLRYALNSITDSAAGKSQLKKTSTTPCHPMPRSSTAPGKDALVTVTSVSKQEKIQRWTMSQAFFAISGGIAVDTGSFYPIARMTFTPSGVLHLAKMGILPDIPVEEVKSRSKQDWAAKTLVCIQASWFIAQMIARGVQGLTISLLEIHTLVQVGCVFAIYALWFQKPYDVEEPIVLKDSNILDAAALFAAESQQARDDSYDDEGVNCNTKDNNISYKYFLAAHAEPRGKNQTWQGLWRNFCFLRPRKMRNPDKHLVYEQFSRANRAIEGMRSIGTHLDFRLDALAFGPYDDREYPPAIKFSAHLITPYQPNSYYAGHVTGDSATPNKYTSKIRSLAGPGFGLGSTVFGSAHLSAWSYDFPTSLEKWFWRGAGLSLCSVPPLVLLMTVFVVWEQRTHSGLAKGTVWWCMILVFILSTPSCIAFYPSRLYLVVECFVSMRNMPSSVYETVEWTKFWPHAG